MHAHAGDPHARAKVARLSQNPKMRAYLAEVGRHLRAHPHYEMFRSHAAQPQGPPHHGVPSAPLPPGAHGHLAYHPHSAGLSSHSTWAGAAPEVGRAQIVGDASYSSGRAQIVGEQFVGVEELVGEDPYYVGHAPHPRGHHHPGHGAQPYGVEWLLEEQDELDRMTSPHDGDPEEWRTPRAPHGTPGI